MKTKGWKLFGRELPLARTVLILGLSTGIAVLSFTGSGTAQVSSGLASQRCVMNGVERWSRDISVGNEVRTSALRISTHPRAGGRRSQMTCSLSSASARPFTALELDLGLPDDEYRVATVFVFLDGNLVRTEQLQPGVSKRLALDVRTSRNVSIEATGESSYGMYPYLYILDATLTQ